MILPRRIRSQSSVSGTLDLRSEASDDDDDCALSVGHEHANVDHARSDLVPELTSTASGLQS
jgi:hypothetical protein